MLGIGDWATVIGGARRSSEKAYSDLGNFLGEMISKKCCFYIGLNSILMEENRHYFSK